jgi:plasmid maintenance system antidote protein VapI
MTIRVEDINDDELVNVFASDWYKQVSAEITPGDWLRTRRFNAGLTQAKLAENLGVGKSYISDLECGRREIGRATAEKLAVALGRKSENFQHPW